MSRDCDHADRDGRCGQPAEFCATPVSDEGYLDGTHRAVCGNGGHLRLAVEALLADGAPSVDIHRWTTA